MCVWGGGGGGGGRSEEFSALDILIEQPLFGGMRIVRIGKYIS